MSESFDAMSGREAEAMKQEVVRDNVRLMDTAMLALLQDESFGSNAGSVAIEGKEYPAAGANAVVDRLTGKLIAFGNRIFAFKAGVEAPLIFRVAVDPHREDPFFRITHVEPGSRRDMSHPGSHRDDVLDTHAVDVLQRSVDQWNAAHEEDVTQP